MVFQKYGFQAVQSKTSFVCKLDFNMFLLVKGKNLFYTGFLFFIDFTYGSLNLDFEQRYDGFSSTGCMTCRTTELPIALAALQCFEFGKNQIGFTFSNIQKLIISVTQLYFDFFRFKNFGHLIYLLNSYAMILLQSFLLNALQIYSIQWNSVNKSISGQPVLDLIRGGFNKRRFLKCTK